jgi:hypothetical protein
MDEKVRHRTLRSGSHLEKFHGKMNSGGITIGDFKITRPCCARRNDHGIVVLTDFLSVDVDSNMSIRDECLSGE